MFLTNKKILLVMPKFISYEDIIISEIEKYGGVVHFYDERNNPSSIRKLLIRKLNFIVSNSINKYYKQIIQLERDFNPDIVFFISPETITYKSFQLMKDTFKTSRFILYMWDSIENKNAKKIFHLFNKCFSFDQNDCEKYGFVFRPLFFSSEFSKVENSSYEYDFGFIGSIHSDRAKILNTIKSECEKKGFSFFYYLFVPSKLLLFFRLFFDKNVRELRKFIYISSLKKETVADILSKCKYVIDINHPKQVGLTMRTIEMLGLRRKLLTTNKYIQQYDFYPFYNPIVIDRLSTKISLLNSSKNLEIPEQIIDRYTITTWLKDILL